jgi:hypothetical protein
MAKRGRGRPSILDEDEQMESRRTKLFAFLRQGASLRAAAGASGLGVSSIMRAMALGRDQKRGRYRDFREQVRRCMDESRVLLETRLFKHSATNARANLAMLKARYPEAWDPHWALRLMELERDLQERGGTASNLPAMRVKRETEQQRETRLAAAAESFKNRRKVAGE